MGAYTFKIHDRSFGVTPVPNIFIDEYMPSADGNFVKVYLAGLVEAFNNNSMPGDFLSRKLGLIESDVVRALEYWELKGLICLTKSSEEMQIEFLNVKDLYSYKSSNTAEKYSPEIICSKVANTKLKDMFESIEKLLGRILSPKELSIYLSWIDDYSFPPEVIILLVEYCKSKNKVDSRYIEKVAMGWHDSNITSLEDAQKYIARHEGKFNSYRQVLEFLGLKENDIMKTQEEFLDKWFNTWEFDLEMILEACKICSLRINEPNFSYIDGILSNWYKNGFKAVKDIEATDSKKKSKNVKFKAPVTTFNSYDQRSYDIKELEKRLLGRSEEDNNE